jgi:ACS family phthalate transporter-like MFS transporter
MPVLFTAYLVVYMDSFNIGFAQLQMSRAIGMSDAIYGMGASITLIAQAVFQVPSNLLAGLIGVRLTIVRILIMWGLVSAATTLVATPNEFLFVRLLAGVCAAGFFPAMMLYVTQWYPSGRRGLATGIFLLAPAVAGMLVGPLSGWLMTAMNHRLGLDGWQWMFLVEALPAFAVAVLVMRSLPGHPASARWLTAIEREIVERNLAEDSRQMPLSRPATFRSAIREPRLLVLGFAYAMVNIGCYCIPFYMPRVISNLGAVNILDVGVYSALPYFVGGIAMILYGRHSDLRLERRRHFAVAVATAIAGFLLLVVAHNVALGLVGLCLAVAGLLCSIAVFWPIPSAFLPGMAAAGGLAFINALGDAGGALSPSLVGILSHTTGSFDVAFWTVSVLLASGAFALMRAIPSGMLRERRPD